MKKYILLFCFVTASVWGWAQSGNVLQRLQGIKSNGIDFYNIDGTNITSNIIPQNFSKATIARAFKDLQITEADLTATDPVMPKPNFVVEKIDTICRGVIQYTTYYFIQNPSSTTTAISYSAANKNDKKLHHEVNKLILEQKIPETVFAKLFFNSFNFAGRNIELGTYACQYTKVNCIQWKYNGEMNWSTHRDSADAYLMINTQRLANENLVSQEFDIDILPAEHVNVLFEGTPVKALKITHKLKGDTETLLKNTGGGNTQALIIYYAAAPVRGNWVSCIMSYWNNDIVDQTTQLPALLSTVMQLVH